MARVTLEKGAKAAATVCDALTERINTVARFRLEWEKAGNTGMAKKAAAELELLFTLQEAAVNLQAAMSRLA